MRLSSLGEKTLDVALSVDDPDDAADFDVIPLQASVPADGATVVQVLVTLPKGMAPGDYQADLIVTAGGAEIAHSPLYVLVK